MNRAVQQAGLIGAARATAQVGLAVTALVIARRFAVEGLGTYAFLTALGSVGVSSAATGAAVLVLRLASRGDWSALRLGQVLLIVSLPGSLVIALAVLASTTSATPQAIVVAGLAYLAVGALTLASADACGRGRFGVAAAGEASAGLATPLLTFAALEAGLGIAGAMVAVLAASLIGASVIMLAPKATPGEDRPAHRLPSLRTLSPFVLMGLASAGYARIDALVVGVAAGERALGIYSAAYRLLGPFLIITGSFGTAFFAQLTREGSVVDAAAIRRGRRTLLALLVPPAVVLAGFAPLVIRALYGTGFDQAVTPARVLLLSVVPLALSWPVAHALNASGREWAWTKVLAGAAIANGVVVAVVAREFGASGVAIAWVGAECGIVFAVARCWRGRRA